MVKEFEYLDFTQYSLGVNHILKCFVDPFDCNSLSCLGVLCCKNMTIGSATDKLLNCVTIIDGDDVLLALELCLPFNFTR